MVSAGPNRWPWSPRTPSTILPGHGRVRGVGGRQPESVALHTPVPSRQLPQVSSGHADNPAWDTHMVTRLRRGRATSHGLTHRAAKTHKSVSDSDCWRRVIARVVRSSNTMHAYISCTSYTKRVNFIRNSRPRFGQFCLNLKPRKDKLTLCRIDPYLNT